MKHLSLNQIEDMAEGHASDELREHVSGCAGCQARVAREVKLERALRALPRTEPASDLASRIQAAIPSEASVRAWTPRLIQAGLAAGLAALIVIVLLYQTGLALQASGALDFISFYADQPDVVTMYPSEALSALIESLPLLEMLVTMGVLFIALALMRRFFAALGSAPLSRSKT